MTNEISVVKPTVNISGSPDSRMYCLRITKRVGVQPSTCTMRYIASNDVTGPVTLSRGSNYKQKQRVLVYDTSTSKVWFNGWLTARQDQHAQNIELWTASDDTILLRDVPVRGCFYVDTLTNGDRQLKYSATLPTTFNPNGAWNCTGHSINGVVYPVFTPTAIYGKAYEKPDADYSGVPNTDGDPEPWTPRRVLNYLRLVMHYDTVFASDAGQFPLPAVIEGMPGTYANSIDTDYCFLDKAHIDGLSGDDQGVDSPLVGDPLDRSMQQLSVQGDTLLGALSKTLSAAGTHELNTVYDTTSGVTTGKTLIRFAPVGYVDQANWKNIDVQFNQTADTTYGTVYDFSLREDSIDTAAAVLVEGEPIKVETRLEYADDPDNDTIVPVWTENEQNSFFACIYGATTLTGANGNYAIFPSIPGRPFSAISGNASDSSVVLADGNNGTPPIRACTPEAVALARQNYPTVFRAFTLKVQGDLKDALEEPVDANGTMIHPRPLLPEQLQFITWLSENVGDTRLRNSLPIRLSFEGPVADEYFDVPKDTAIRTTTDAQGDNLLWLDGAAEGADGTLECLYTASLYNDVAENIKSGNIAVKKFRLNAAMATDYRTVGKSTKQTADWLSTDYAEAFSGAQDFSFRYLDRPGSFREYLQYNSYPASGTTYIDGTGTATMPLTREVPPGSEYENAAYAAQREMARRGQPVRTSTWMQAGIQAGFDSGDWIGFAYVWENGQNVTNYLINGFIRTVVYDFVSQTTRVGDTYSQFGAQF